MRFLHDTNTENCYFSGVVPTVADPIKV
jgi:hypothetical protein